jgi:hypothetical protein
MADKKQETPQEYCDDIFKKYAKIKKNGFNRKINLFVQVHWQHVYSLFLEESQPMLEEQPGLQEQPGLPEEQPG